jgi:hypothetical protein
MSQNRETTHCEGSLVTHNGALSLAGVSVTGAKHGAGINDVSTGPVPARLTVTASTIAHNTNDDVANDAGAAGDQRNGNRRRSRPARDDRQQHD